MLSWRRALIGFAAVVGAEVLLVSAVTAASITGAEMEALSDGIVAIFTGLGAFVSLLLGSLGIFLWRMFRAWNPNELDPMEMLFYKRLKKDADLSPILERMERMDKAIAILAERAVKEDKPDEKMGSAEYFLRNGD